jgi:hypothetical protein
MIFVVFFLFLLYTQIYFSALIKSHLFDITIESVSTRQLQTNAYIESICIYIGSIITKTESIRTSDQEHTIHFSEIHFDTQDAILVTVSIIKEIQDQFLLNITCIRSNKMLQYHARIKITTSSFTITEYEQSKKELFQ